MSDQSDLTMKFYPEKAVGGYSSVDGTVEFYGRVNALLNPEMRVLDFGAGRAAWYQSDRDSYRSQLRDLRPKVDSLVACDIDRAVLDNQSADENVVIDAGSPLPFGDEEFNLIVSDFVFEHLDDPLSTANELDRILKPGGWICARTPNRRGYVSVLTRLIPNDWHVRVLGHAQPTRQARDVFPTRFGLNTRSDVGHAFPATRFDNHTYYYDAEPSYHFGRSVVYATMSVVNSVLPRALRSNLFIFLRKLGA